jgi:hypothetical protein
MQTFNGITLYLYSRPPTTFTVVSR